MNLFLSSNPDSKQNPHQHQQTQPAQTAITPPSTPYTAFYVSQFVALTTARANAELQTRARILSRIDMYLSVLYNLMQQQIARDTKRDSSSLKSIALLTMVFLPATAIATIA